jgi:hypothetical protein
MDFSTFGTAGSGFLPPKTKAPSTPPEMASLTVYKSRICELHLPYNTSRSAAIRAYQATWLVLSNGTRMFIFRKLPNGTGKWTTVAHDSTPESPKLTASPEQVVAVSLQHMPKCSDIASFTVRDWMGREITASDVPQLPFDPLPGEPTMTPPMQGAAPHSVSAVAGMQMQPTSTGMPYSNHALMTSASTPSSATPTPWSMGYSLSTPAVPPGAAPSMPMTASSFMPSNPTAPSSVDPDADTLPVQFGGSVQMRLDTLTVNFSRDLMQLKTYIDSKFQEALGEHEVKMISAITKVKSDLNTKFEAVALSMCVLPSPSSYRPC